MKIFAIALMVLVLPFAAQAEVDSATEQRIRSSLQSLLPGLVPDRISATPIDNLFEVTFGMRLVYVTDDGRFLLQGKVIDLQTRQELTEQRMSELKMAALAEIGEDQMVIYGPQDARHTVTVLTDIDCGYCRKMHADMAKYNAEGIRIRYLFYPRAGVGSPSGDKAVSVWCAEDRHAAMDQAKAGKDLEPRSCDNPVAEHYAFGQAIRVQGTPALVLENGEVIPGYVPADKLRKALDQLSAAPLAQNP